MGTSRIGVVALLLILGSCGGADGGAGVADESLAADTTPATETTLAPDTSPVAETTLAPDTTGMMEDDHDEGEVPAEAGHDDGETDDTMHEDGNEAPDDTVAGARVIEVSMTDFAFEPADVSVSAGETVTFRISNDGQIVHEFRLSNAHRIEEHLAEGHADHGDDGHHGDADVVLELEPGEHGELTVTFPEDTSFFTEVACLIPGHFEAGMKGVVDYG